jgi:hypothetical protein
MKFIEKIKEAEPTLEEAQIHLELIYNAVIEDKMQNKSVAKIAKQIHNAIELLKTIAKDAEKKLL